MVHAQYRAQAEGESLEFEPQYEYPGQWFDDLGQLMMVTGETGAAGWDIGRSPYTRGEQRDLSRTLMNSGIQAYD